MASGIETTIEFQMSLLLFVALLGYRIAASIHQTVIVGEIAMGLIIGPSLLGLITYNSSVGDLARIGAIVLLFVVGMEFSFSSVYRLRYFFIALLGVVVPWMGGFYVTRLYAYDLSTSVFVGAALTATSIIIPARYLKEVGKLHTKEGEAIIGASVIDDILGLIVLTFSMQLIHGSLSFAENAVPLLKILLFLTVGYWAGKNLFRAYLMSRDEFWLTKRFPETKFVLITRRYPEMGFMFALMVAFLYSMAAEWVGLSAIIGAFLAGVSLSGIKQEEGHNFHEGAEYMRIVFSGVFFVSLGILVDLHQIGYSTLSFVLALSAVAIATKAFGCYAGAVLQGMSPRESVRIGLGMVPRGEVAMVTALIGLTTKILTPEVYASIVFMGIISSVFTAVVMKWAYRD